MMGPKEKNVLRYLNSAQVGGVEVDVDTFDWEFWPIGSRLRHELLAASMIAGHNGKLTITEAGRAALRGGKETWE